SANADARAASEGKVDEPGQLLDALRRPARRVKLLRVGKVAWVAMHDPLAHHHAGVELHPVTADLAWLDGASSHGPSWRIKPYGFLHHTPWIPQPGPLLRQ